MDTAAMTNNLCEHAIEILQATNDGEDLAPQHLKLVECAVNGLLNDAGLAAFGELLTNVRAGYKRPWFHDVQHVTLDHQGYVLWKGQPIEHFSPNYAQGDDAKAYVQELARRCLIIEASGQLPTTTSVVWRWCGP